MYWSTPTPGGRAIDQFSSDGYLENLPKNCLNIDRISTVLFKQLRSAVNIDLNLPYYRLFRGLILLIIIILGAKHWCSLPVNLRTIPSAKRLLRKNYLNCF